MCIVGLDFNDSSPELPGLYTAVVRDVGRLPAWVRRWLHAEGIRITATTSGNLGSRAAGKYYQKFGVIEVHYHRFRAPRHETRTLYHEIGHAFDFRTKPQCKMSRKREIKAIFSKYRPNNKYGTRTPVFSLLNYIHSDPREYVAEALGGHFLNRPHLGNLGSFGRHVSQQRQHIHGLLDDASKALIPMLNSAKWSLSKCVRQDEYLLTGNSMWCHVAFSRDHLQALSIYRQEWREQVCEIYRGLAPGISVEVEFGEILGGVNHPEIRIRAFNIGGGRRDVFPLYGMEDLPSALKSALRKTNFRHRWSKFSPPYTRRKQERLRSKIGL